MNKLPEGLILKILDIFNIEYRIYNRTIKVKCPFHDDNDPSATVDIKRNIFFCFVCKEMLNKRAGVGNKSKGISSKNLFMLLGGNEDKWKKLVKETYKNGVDLKGFEHYFSNNKRYNGFFNNLWESLSKEPDNRSKNYLLKRKIDVDALSGIEVRFIKNGIYSKWSIAVPIFDIEKKMVGIQLRASSDEVKPKSISYPGSSLGFFGLNSVKRGDYTIVVEGLTDFLTAKSLGFKNVIGIISSAQTIPESLSLFFSNRVLFFLHNDECGLLLYEKVKNIVKGKGIKLTALKTSRKPGGDLNSFVQEKQIVKVILMKNLIKLTKGGKL